MKRETDRDGRDLRRYLPYLSHTLKQDKQDIQFGLIFGQKNLNHDLFEFLFIYFFLEKLKIN